MNNRKFVDYLFYYVDDNNIPDRFSLLDPDIMKPCLGGILSKVFSDVTEFEVNDKTFKMADNFDGNFKYLGEIFTEKFNDYQKKKGVLPQQFGMFNKWWRGDTEIQTVANLAISFFDDKFVVKTSDENKSEVKSLMKPEYQKRYVTALAKRFGSAYKKHYKKLVKEQSDNKQDEVGLVK